MNWRDIILTLMLVMLVWGVMNEVMFEDEDYHARYSFKDLGNEEVIWFYNFGRTGQLVILVNGSVDITIYRNDEIIFSQTVSDEVLLDIEFGGGDLYKVVMTPNTQSSIYVEASLEVEKTLLRMYSFIGITASLAVLLITRFIKL